MTGAGDLTEKIGFYRRIDQDDGAGNVVSEYDNEPVFPAVSAQLKPKLGGEAVIAARLTGVNLVNIVVRRSSNTLQVTTEWRAKDERTGELFNIRSIIDPDGKRQWLEMLCEKGAAT